MNSMTRAWLLISTFASLGCLAWGQPCTPPAMQVASPRNACDSVIVSLTSLDYRPSVRYRLWRQVEAGPSAVVAEFDRLPREWRDASVPAMVDVLYQLEARDGACVTTSGWSRVRRSAQTAIPTEISATDMTDCNRIVISWTAGECGEMVTVWRAEYPEFGAAMPLGTVWSYDAGSFVDSQVELEVPCFYWLTAQSALGESPAAGPLLGRAADLGPTYALVPWQYDVFAPELPASIELSTGGGEVTDMYWSKDGTRLIESDRISGTTTHQLLFASIAYSDAGRYELTASNQCGTTTSEPVDVTVSLDACFPACRCETNNDGGLDGGDIAYFLELWESGQPCGDWNLDGGVDSSDVSDYLQAWEMCCC